MYNDVVTDNVLIYRIILCSLQLLVGVSAGADSKGQTSLGMYIIDNSLYRNKQIYIHIIKASLICRPSLLPVFDYLQYAKTLLDTGGG